MDAAGSGFAPELKDHHHAALATVDEVLDLELGVLPHDLHDLGEAFDECGGPERGSRLRPVLVVVVLDVRVEQSLLDHGFPAALVPELRDPPNDVHVLLRHRLLRQPGGLESVLPRSEAMHPDDLATVHQQVDSELLVEVDVTCTASEVGMPQPQDRFT